MAKSSEKKPEEKTMPDRQRGRMPDDMPPGMPKPGPSRPGGTPANPGGRGRAA